MTLAEIKQYAEHTGYLSALLKNAAEIIEQKEREVQQLKAKLNAQSTERTSQEAAD